MKKRKINILDTQFAPFVALIINLFIAFALYLIARIEFLLENYSYFSADLSVGHLLRLFGGGYMFDRSAIVYTNS